MADIFDEVQEDLRAERARRLLLRFGGVIIGCAVLIVAGVGAWQAWRWYRARSDMAVAEIYMTGLRAAIPATPGGAADRPAAIGAFDRVAAAGPDGYRTLARLWAAAEKADGGDLAGAASLYDAVAADGSADPLLRDYARLMWVTRQLDTADPAVLAGRLTPLTDPANAWHALAQEAQALLALRRGAPEEARQTLRALSADQTAPDGVRGRANGLLGRLGG